jgi:hypothetical protein
VARFAFLCVLYDSLCCVHLPCPAWSTVKPLVSYVTSISLLPFGGYCPFPNACKFRDPGCAGDSVHSARHSRLALECDREKNIEIAAGYFSPLELLAVPPPADLTGCSWVHGSHIPPSAIVHTISKPLPYPFTQYQELC